MKSIRKSFCTCQCRSDTHHYRQADEYNRDTNQFYSWKDNRPLPDEPVHSKAPGAVEKNFDEGKNKDTNDVFRSLVCNSLSPSDAPVHDREKVVNGKKDLTKYTVDKILSDGMLLLYDKDYKHVKLSIDEIYK